SQHRLAPPEREFVDCGDGKKVRDVVPRWALAGLRVVVVLDRGRTADSVFRAVPAALIIQRLRPGVGNKTLQTVREALVQLGLKGVVPAAAIVVAIEHCALPRKWLARLHLCGRARSGCQRG